MEALQDIVIVDDRDVLDDPALRAGPASRGPALPRRRLDRQRAGPRARARALESAGVSKEELDWLVPHQANIRIIQATAKRLDLPMEKVIVTVQDHGNTSAASVPMALDVGIRDGRIKPGHTILLEAFGGGFTWGSALITM